VGKPLDIIKNGGRNIFDRGKGEAMWNREKQ